MTKETQQIKEDDYLEYIGKKVRVYILSKEDIHSRARDGIFLRSNLTHILLLLDNAISPVSFLRETIKRIEVI